MRCSTPAGSQIALVAGGEPGSVFGRHMHDARDCEDQLRPGMAMLRKARARAKGEGEGADVEPVFRRHQSNTPGSYCMAPTRLPSQSSK